MKTHKMGERNEEIMKFRKTIGVVGLACLLLFQLFGCGVPGRTPEASEPVGNDDDIIKEIVTESPDTRATNPLTGLPMETGSEEDRPIAIMLNNIRVALPQFGVSKADQIYEVCAEGGITRMLAVFQSLDGVGDLGSVRSTRLYYLDLAQGLDAILVHAGGSEEAYSTIQSRGMFTLDGVRGAHTSELFWRDQTRIRSAGYEHSLFTSGEKLQALFPSLSVRKTHESGYTYPMAFSDDGTPNDGATAKKISVVFSNYKTGVFEYDESSGLYKVSEYGKPYVDGETDEQVCVKNVLVLYTGISNLPGDTSGRLRVQLTGSGTGIYACNGKVSAITWSKAGPDSPFQYAYEDGTPVEFGRGVSYINIVKDGQASVSND